MNDLGRNNWSSEEAWPRDWVYGDIGAGRKRKTYDHDIDWDERDRYERRLSRFDNLGLGHPLSRFGGTGDRFGGMRDRFGGVGDRFGFPHSLLENLAPTLDDFGLGWGRSGFGYDYPVGETFIPRTSRIRQPSAQAIGEAGFDLSLSRRATDEERFKNMRDWDRVAYSPNIDEATLWRPRADVFEQGPDAIRVEFEIPGVPKEDISLTVRDNVITLTALKPQSRKEEAGFHYQNERHFGKFYRRLALPFSVDPTTSRSVLEHGVLKVHLNKGDTGSSRVHIGESSVTVGAPGTSGGTTTDATART